MKIDEKVISYFESCNSPVDKEGYLSKKGEIKTSYQRRWFVLKGNLLFYKERPSDRDLIGVIVVEGCTIQLCESEEQFAFSLVWNDPGLRTYKFAAEDQVSQESWIKALLSASHSYLSLLLIDMEKKYRDALAAAPSEPAKPFIMPNFNTAAVPYPAPVQSVHTQTLPSYLAPVLGAGAVMTSSPILQDPNTLKPVNKNLRSPKLRPKRNANMVSNNNAALSIVSSMEEWPEIFSTTKEDFGKLHEDFGKEIKELIASWSKKVHGGGAVQEENLIDFG
ncbi:sesquipedalian-1-like isoform 1-T2 [Pholidichthys leucotaenia]